MGNVAEPFGCRFHRRPCGLADPDRAIALVQDDRDGRDRHTGGTCNLNNRRPLTFASHSNSIDETIKEKRFSRAIIATTCLQCQDVRIVGGVSVNTIATPPHLPRTTRPLPTRPAARAPWPTGRAPGRAP